MLDRMRTGAAFGLIMATLYSGWVLVLFLLKGSAPFEANGVTAWGVVLSYYATGVIAGGVVGLLAPLVHSRFGAILVGWVAAFFVVVGIAINMFGFVTRWHRDEWLLCTGLALFFGVVGANTFWSKPVKVE